MTEGICRWQVFLLLFRDCWLQPVKTKKDRTRRCGSNPIRCGWAREGHALSAGYAEPTLESYGPVLAD